MSRVSLLHAATLATIAQPGNAQAPVPEDLLGLPIDPALLATASGSWRAVSGA
jgi:hypothetical protein